MYNNMKFFLYSIILSSELSVILADCTDIYGKSITPNAHFIPGPDICQLCVCDNTIPKWCKRVLCSPPQNCKSFVMGSSCCDYSCLDNTLPNVELHDDIDRRFLITLATGFVILTVLLFVIHKIRHRSIHERLQARPLNEDRRSLGSIGFITGSIGYLNLPNAHNFDEHPIVHFPIYKPNGYYSRGEAPPPYDEAMADARLTSYGEIEMISNERCLQDPNYQRRRQILNHPLVIDTAGNCIAESRPGENGVFVEESDLSDNIDNVRSISLQHRTIPLPLCGNSERAGLAAESTLPSVGSITHSRSLHEKNNDFNHPRVPSNAVRRSCTSASRTNTCPAPQLHLEVTSLDETATLPLSLPYRSVPLSASLSSPLPSTSDADRQDQQFAGVASGPTYSSATNICPSSNNGRSDAKVAPQQPSRKHHHHHHHHHKSCRKALQASAATADADDTLLTTVRPSNEQRGNKSSYSREPAVAPSGNKEVKEESPEACSAAEDYFAECENCNLTVAAGADTCDATDEYFSKQKAMTLQRQFYEVFVAPQTPGKVSLTLPTNSRTRHRKCPSKNRKCGMWNPPYKATLELVSSEDERQEEASAEAAAATTKPVKSPELSVDDVPKNEDEKPK